MRNAYMSNENYAHENLKFLKSLLCDMVISNFDDYTENDDICHFVNNLMIEFNSPYCITYNIYYDCVNHCYILADFEANVHVKYRNVRKIYDDIFSLFFD